MNKPVRSRRILAALVFPFSLSAQAPSFTIQVDHPIATVSPTLYGLMTEEINYSYDGGIYGELVRDRAIGRGLGLAHPLAHGGARQLASQCLVRRDHRPQRHSHAQPAASPSPQPLQAAPAGVENDGYWGIPVRPHTTYTGSFYAKTDAPGIPITVSLQNDQTGVVAATATVTGLTGEWKQFTYTLKTGDVPVSSNNHLILTIAQSGDGLVQPGFALSAHLSRAPRRQSHRHHEPAGCHAAEISAPARRQLS